MRPFAFLLGVVTGSAVAIAVCLGMVLVVFLLLRAEHPQFGEELPTLTRFTLLFAIYGGIGLASLFAQLRARPWKRWAVAALVGWSIVVIIAARWWISGGH